MDKFVIEGRRRLSGEVEVSSAKNAVLPIMAASILVPGEVTLHNISEIRDVWLCCRLLKALGANVSFSDKTLKIDGSTINKTLAPYELVKQMRASFLVAGPLLTRFGEARVSFPGGCALGVRKIDIHLKSFERLGAKVEQEEGYILLRGRLKGAKCYLDYPTHTGTENIMMAAVLATGETLIENAACEPEVVDLANFLNKMGARIEGAGSKVIKIQGVSSLVPCEYSPIPDRIEAATMMMAAAITKGRVFIRDAPIDLLDAPIAKLSEMGVTIEEKEAGILVIGPEKMKATEIVTGPYPTFSTDLQPMIASLLCIADGTSIIKETVFDNRFLYAQELARMGARLEVSGGQLTIEGINELSGANVMAQDIRGGAGLVLAGLSAKGTTIIDRVYHIDRGYCALCEKLSMLGAKIQRISQKD
jgi:UDP-N-acetylglucosamine 1-carboxyvinyltransferase